MLNRLTAYNDLLTTLGRQASILICLQYIYALRIGELLSCRRCDLNNEGFLYIKGLKRSSGGIIYVPELLQEPFCKSLKPNEPIFTISYNQYYRIVSRLNVHRRVKPGKHRNKVTHAFRHIRLQINEKFAHGDYESQKNFSRHKSNKGLSYYLINTKLSKNGSLESINQP